MTIPEFPPLLQGQATVDDPLDVAVKMARAGCDAGTVVYNLNGNDLRAALIFAPEVPLEDAMAMYPACAVGFQNALGAIAPPEIAVHLAWHGGIIVNGAACGDLMVRSATTDPAEVPDWLVIAVQVPLWPESDAPGETPDQTALYAEGCADVMPLQLLEGWARHTLLWVSRWLDEGPAPLHTEWQGLLHKPDDYVGLDERFGLLRRHEDTSTLIPLTTLLELS